MIQMFKHGLLAICLFFITCTGTWAHTAAFNRMMRIGGTNLIFPYYPEVTCKDMKIDGQKNFISVGSFTNTIDFDQANSIQNLTSIGFKDGFISKRDSNFNLIWAGRLGNNRDDIVNRVETDSWGNIYIAGRYQGIFGQTTNFDINGGSFMVSNQVNDNFGFNSFIAKYDNDGNVLWVKNTNIAVLNDFEVGDNGQIYATGYFPTGTLTIDNQSIVASGTSDMFVLSLATNGSLNWLKQIENTTVTPVFNTTPQAAGSSISLDATGNILLTGSFNNTFDFDPSSNINNLTSQGNSDAFILKLNSLGNFVWVQQVGGVGWDVGTCIITDQTNHIYVSGTFDGTLDVDAGSGVYTIVSGYTSDTNFTKEGAFLLKLNSNGSLVFGDAFGRPKSTSSTWGNIDVSQIELDQDQNIYMVGAIEGIIDFDPSPATYVLNGPSNIASFVTEKSAYITKIHASGNLDWVKLLGNAGAYCAISSIQVDQDERVYTTGWFRDAIDFNTEAGNYTMNGLVPGYSVDFFLHEIGPCFTTAIDTQIVFGQYTWGNGTTYTATNYTALDTFINTQGCDSLVTLHLDILPVPTLMCNVNKNSIHQGKGLGWLVTNCSSITNGEERMYSFTPSNTGNYYLQVSNASGNHVNWFMHDQSFGTLNTNWTCIGRTNSSTSFALGILTAGVTYYILGDAEGTALSAQTISITSDVLSMPVVSGASPICGIQSATLVVTNLPGAIIQWYDAASGGNLLATSSIYTTPVLSTSQNYWAQASNACGIATARTQVSQIVHPIPSVTANASNTKVCKNSAIVLQGGGASSYTWSSGGFNNIPFPISATTIYTVTGTDANNCTNTSTIEIEVKELPSIGINASQDTLCNGDMLLLAGTGGSAYTWSGGVVDQVGFVPTTTTTYTVTGTGAYNCTNTATHTVVVRNCNLNLKFFLQGYYIANGLMQPVLNNQGNSTQPNTLCDTVTVELHKYFSPYQLVETQKGILHTDGLLMVNFNADPTQEYYLVIKHRNHLQSWSSSFAPFLNVNGIINFTSSAEKIAGGNQAEVEPGVFALYAGDINQDGYIDGFDYPAYDSDVQNNVSGVYVNTDLNGDGYVDGFDYPLFDENSQNNVSVITP